MLNVHAPSTPPDASDNSHPPWPGSKRWRMAFNGGSTRTACFHLLRWMSSPTPSHLRDEDPSKSELDAKSLLSKSFHDLTKPPMSTKNKPPPLPLPTSSEPSSRAIQPYDAGHIGGTRMRRRKDTRNLSLIRLELSACDSGLRAAYAFSVFAAVALMRLSTGSGLD